MEKYKNLISINNVISNFNDKKNNSNKEKAYHSDLNKHNDLKYERFQQIMDLINRHKNFLLGPEKSAIAQFVVNYSEEIIRILQNTRCKKRMRG